MMIESGRSWLVGLRRSLQGLCDMIEVYWAGVLASKPFVDYDHADTDSTAAASSSSTSTSTSPSVHAAVTELQRCADLGPGAYAGPVVGGEGGDGDMEGNFCTTLRYDFIRSLFKSPKNT